MKNKAVYSIFWITVGFFFLAILGVVLTEIVRGFMPYFMAATGVILIGLGTALIVLTVKKGVTGKPRIFLLLTGASAAGIPVFAVLHNLVYALFILCFGEGFWGASGDEPVFFILAIIVCPLTFLTGAIGTTVLAIKNKLNTPLGTVG